MIGICLLALSARYIALATVLVSQVSGTPLFVTESGKIQAKLIQGFFRAAFGQAKPDSDAGPRIAS